MAKRHVEAEGAAGQHAVLAARHELARGRVAGVRKMRPDCQDSQRQKRGGSHGRCRQSGKERACGTGHCLRFAFKVSSIHFWIASVSRRLLLLWRRQCWTPSLTLATSCSGVRLVASVEE